MILVDANVLLIRLQPILRPSPGGPQVAGSGDLPRQEDRSGQDLLSLHDLAVRPVATAHRSECPGPV
jgi:hypothetical protein